MDDQGFLADPGEVGCEECGKPLNPNGVRPAELYAGTFTGLCYACERAGPFKVLDFLSGATEWSHPPHCPSWRRDRETFIGIEGCPKCKGKGRIMISRSDPQGGPYPKQCEACSKTHREHESSKRLDAALAEWRERHDTWKKEAQATYDLDLANAGAAKGIAHVKNDKTTTELIDSDRKIARAVLEKIQATEPRPPAISDFLVRCDASDSGATEKNVSRTRNFS